MKRVGMALLWVLVLLLLCSPALVFAQCLPKSVFPNESGTDYRLIETPYVEGRVGWCLVARTAAGDQWKQVVYQWQLKRLAVPPTLKPFAVLDQLRAASSPMAAASAISAQLSVPLTDPADIVRWRQWRYDACIALITPPYTLTTTPFDPGTFPPGYCGTRPPDPGQAWKTVGGTIFTYASGRLTGIVSGRRVAAGQACDCSAFSTTSGSSRYCQTAPGEASQCILSP